MTKSIYGPKNANLCGRVHEFKKILTFSIFCNFNLFKNFLQQLSTTL